MTIINKIAFLVHEPIMYAHYSSIWTALKRDAFTVVLLNAFSDDDEQIANGVAECIDRIRNHGYAYAYLDDLLRRGVRYRYVVSNHCIGGSSVYPSQKSKRTIMDYRKEVVNRASVWFGGTEKYAISYRDPVQYIPLQVGIRQIRFMYGADIGEGWSLQPWNEIYDLFLCHGPNDEAAFRKRFRGRTAIMGYPRYDGYFSQDLDISSVVGEFELDPSKKTILWMSTTGQGASSIPGFAALISGLQEHYNVIARPHPIAFRAEPENIAMLRSFKFKVDSNALRDMNRLYRAVDFVLCDYGGSSFSAIYLGKKLILLDVPGSESCSWLLNASNLALRELVPLVGVEDFQNIHRMIPDQELWDEWDRNRSILSRKYFADYRGTSSLKAAEILANLDSLIGN